MRQVQFEEAEQHFASLVSEAEAGESLTILRGEKAIAQIIPFPAQVDDSTREAAWKQLEALMDKGLDLGGTWDGRDQLYDRD